MNERQELQLEKIKNKMLSRGGECLFDSYINNITKMELKCDKGHLWRASYSQILNHNQWCPECNIDKQRNNINEIITIIEDKGGDLLTNNYKNNKQKLKIKCSEGHIWNSSYSVIKKGHWCPDCAFVSSKLTEEEKLSAFNFICKIVEEKGGKCLSTLGEYKHILSKLIFQCAKNHEWETTASSIKHNVWCPICCQSLSEKLFRGVMEIIFNYKFSSCRPKWLKSDKNYTLQIDGYNKELKLGFEYQGKQHFVFSSFFHKTQENLERRKINDKTKAKILKDKNIFMLYPTYKLEKEDYFSFIKNRIIDTPYKKLANFNQKIDINDMYKII